MNHLLIWLVFLWVPWVWADDLSLTNNYLRPVDITQVTQAAEKGDAYAQSVLGFKYYLGADGVPQDAQKAFEWYLKAAEGGNAYSQSVLGNAYSQGSFGSIATLTPNYELAYVWSSLAIAQGMASAQVDRDNAIVSMTPEQLTKAKQMLNDWLLAHKKVSTKNNSTTQSKNAEIEDDKVYKALDAAIPDWKQVNKNEDFLSWLDTYELDSGVQRKVLLSNAFKNNNSEKVVSIFKDYLMQTKNGNASQGNAHAAYERAVEETKKSTSSFDSTPAPKQASTPRVDKAFDDTYLDISDAMYNKNKMWMFNSPDISLPYLWKFLGFLTVIWFACYFLARGIIKNFPLVKINIMILHILTIYVLLIISYNKAAYVLTSLALQLGVKAAVFLSIVSMVIIYMQRPNVKISDTSLNMESINNKQELKASSRNEYCHKCGHPVLEQAKFCSKCGASID